jgi:hypothetical protein
MNKEQKIKEAKNKLIRLTKLRREMFYELAIEKREDQKEQWSDLFQIIGGFNVAFTHFFDKDLIPKEYQKAEEEDLKFRRIAYYATAKVQDGIKIDFKQLDYAIECIEFLKMLKPKFVILTNTQRLVITPGLTKRRNEFQKRLRKIDIELK